jgi:hypothetical protein
MHYYHEWYVAKEGREEKARQGWKARDGRKEGGKEGRGEGRNAWKRRKDGRPRKAKEGRLTKEG